MYCPELGSMVFNLRLTGKEPIGYESPSRIYIRTACLHPRIVYRRFVVLYNLVFIESQIATYRKECLLTQPLCIVHRQLYTFIFYDTQISIRVFDPSGVAGDCTALQEDVVATFLEKVDYKGQIIIQELDIDTQVLLSGFRPSDIYTILFFSITVGTCIIGSEHGSCQTGEHPLIHEASACCGITADPSVRIAEFEEGNVFADRIPERFIGNCPSQTKSREDTITLARTEVLRTIDTEIEFCEVTVVP